MTLDEMNRMAREIALGIPREQSAVPMTPEAIKHWEILSKQITDIIADGYEVEIPFETPSVDVVNPDMMIKPVDQARDSNPPC